MRSLPGWAGLLVGLVIGVVVGILIGRPFNHSHLPLPLTGSAPYVATWSTGRLSKAELERRIAAQPGLFRGNQRQELLIRQMVDEELLADEAQASGLALRPDILQKLRQFIAGQYLAQTIQKRVPSEADLRAYYEANRAQFEQPERVKVSHLFLAASVDDPLLKRRKRAQMERLAKLIDAEDKKDPFAFTRTVQAFSEDPASKGGGGSLGALSKEELSKFAQGATEEVFALAPGKRSDVIETKEGLELFKMDGRLPKVVVPFEQAKEQIRVLLGSSGTAKAMRALFDDLERKASVRFEF